MTLSGELWEANVDLARASLAHTLYAVLCERDFFQGVWESGDLGDWILEVEEVEPCRPIHVRWHRL